MERRNGIIAAAPMPAWRFCRGGGPRPYRERIRPFRSACRLRPAAALWLPRPSSTPPQG